MATSSLIRLLIVLVILIVLAITSGVAWGTSSHTDGPTADYETIPQSLD